MFSGAPGPLGTKLFEWKEHTLGSPVAPSPSETGAVASSF